MSSRTVTYLYQSHQSGTPLIVNLVWREKIVTFGTGPDANCPRTYSIAEEGFLIV